MAVDFGILERTPTIGSRFMEGQQAAQQQAERNMLRQMQMQQMAIQQENMLAQRENMAAQREERAAHAEERRARIAQAQAAEARLAQFGTAWKQLTGKDQLTEADVRQIEGEAFASRDPNALTLAKGLRADFNTREEARRIFGGEMPTGAAPMPTGAPTVAAALEAPTAAAAPAMPAPEGAPVTPQNRTVMFGGIEYTPSQLAAMRASPTYRGLYEKIAEAQAKRDIEEAKLRKPTYQARTRGDVAEVLEISGGGARVVPGSQAAIALTEAQRLQDQRERERIKIDGQRLGLEGRRLAIAERDSALSRDPVFQQQMAAARAKGEAIAKGEAAAKLALPGAIANAEDAVNIIDQMVGKQEVRDKNNKIVQAATKPHPGFENAVGTTWLPGARFNPGTDAANFQALFDQTQGAAFLEAYNVLRGAGAITNDEGKKATAARSRMSLAQSEAEFIAAAREYQSVIRKGLKVLKEKSGAGGGATGDWSIVR